MSDDQGPTQQSEAVKAEESNPTINIKVNISSFTSVKTSFSQLICGIPDDAIYTSVYPFCRYSSSIRLCLSTASSQVQFEPPFARCLYILAIFWSSNAFDFHPCFEFFILWHSQQN